MNENEEQKLRKLLKASPPLDPPESFYRGVLQKIERESERARVAKKSGDSPAVWRERGRAWYWNIPFKTLATACVLLLVVFATRETRKIFQVGGNPVPLDSVAFNIPETQHAGNEPARMPGAITADSAEPQLHARASAAIKAKDVPFSITKTNIQIEEDQIANGPAPRKEGFLKDKARAQMFASKPMAPGRGGDTSMGVASAGAPTAAAALDVGQAASLPAPKAAAPPVPWQMENRNSVSGVATNGSFLTEREVMNGKKASLAKALPVRTDKNFQISGPAAARAIVHKAVPAYPEWAEEVGAQGTVRIYFRVTADGTVNPHVRITRTTGYPDLDKLAIDAIKTWKFTAASQETSGIVSFEFPPKN